MLGAHALVLVCLVVAGALGLWQYDAWQARRAAEAADLTRLEPVPLTEVMGPDVRFPGEEVGRPVVLDGSWVPGATVFVSGREHEGEQGVWVVTPLAIGSPDAPAVPVVRGWSPDPARAPAPPSGPARLVGWLQPPEGTGADDPDPTDDVYPQLRVADLVQRLDQDLYGAYAVAAPGRGSPVNAGTDGLAAADLAEMPEAGRFTALRNLLYALEWWFFGGFAVFIWWRFVSEQRGASNRSTTSPTGAQRVERPDSAVGAGQ